GRKLCLIDEGSIGAGAPEIRRRCTQLREDGFDASRRFALFPKVSPAGDLFDRNGTRRGESLQGEEDRAGAFAHDHSARWVLEWFNRRRGTKQAPFAICVAQ